MPPEGPPGALRLDADVLAWFRAQGDSDQTRRRAVLREFYKHHHDASA